VLGRRSVAVIGPHAGGALRHAAAVTVCALAAHAVAYGSLVPQDGEHRYFGWYAPLVATLSATALLGVLLALTIALVVGPSSRAAAVVRSILPARSSDGSAVAGLFSLASAALVFLAVQESLERSLAANRLQLVSFAPGTLALLVGIVVLAAGVVVAVQRLVSSLAEVVLRPERPRRSRAAAAPARRRGVLLALRPRSPLAVHAGLRAPPLGS
jgi:hypothetical protein